MKVDEYYVVINASVVLMMNEVSQYIKKGWEPIGGIAIEMFPNGETRYYQSIVKKV